MAAALAALSAFWFALAAALQQKGEFHLAAQGRRVTGVGTLLRLIVVPVWLLGTAILLLGYVTQGVALGKGRLVVVQPLLVLTIVFALPLGHWLTQQHVTRRQVGGALLIVAGLAMFVLVGDPNAGVTSAPPAEYLMAIAIACAPAGAFLIAGAGASPSRKAAAFGLAAGLLFGLSATFSKATVDQLKDGLDVVLTHGEVYGLVGFGIVAFGIQQLSLATGQFAPAMAAVSVANPAVSVLLGILLFDERLTRPFWHVIVACLALLAAFAGAVLVTVGNRDRELPSGQLGTA